MDISEVIGTVAKSVDPIAVIQALAKEKKLDKDDIQILLLTSILEHLKTMNTRLENLASNVGNIETELKNLRNEVVALREDVKNMHRDLRDRLDLISNQLRVLNTNIASTYELTSKVVSLLMAKGLPVAP
jgi:predicted  nucleic acid-binding Zn-ribbon protein